MRQQHKVNCWYCCDESWTLVEDSCLCLLVKLSVEDNSREREKETRSIKIHFLNNTHMYNWTTTITGQKEHHKLAAKECYYCHLFFKKACLMQ